MRTRGTAALACAVLLLGLLPPAAARNQADEEPEVTLELVDQPVWHAPEDPLGLQLRIANGSGAALEGFTLALEAHARVSSRSALQAAFDGAPGLFGSGTSLAFDAVVEPGATHTVVLDGIAIRDFGSLAAAADGGVYPLAVTLGSQGVPLDSLTTPLIVYPSAPQTRLGVVPLLTLNDIPARGPDGAFLTDDDGEMPLERALAPGGWLTGLLEVLDATAGELPPTVERERVRTRRGRKPRIRVIRRPTPSVHLALALVPRLVEELADMADGYRVDDREMGPGSEGARRARLALQTLRRLVGEIGVLPAVSPYSFPDLPEIVANLPSEQVALQFEEGRRVLDTALDLDTGSGWLVPPAGRIDAETLASLPGATAGQRLLVAPDSLVGGTEPDTGCPETSPSFTCAIAVESATGSARGFVADPGLQQRVHALMQAGDDGLDLQRLFAETSVIREELPGIEGRYVHLSFPSLWHPPEALAQRLLEGLRTAPWLRTSTPSEALADPGVEVAARTLVTSIQPSPGAPDTSLYARVAQAASLVSSLDLVHPPPELTRRLLHDLMVAVGRTWWRDDELLARAFDYAEAADERVRDELGKLTLGGPDEIRLTSRQGEVPLVVFNDADYAATVDLEVIPPGPDIVVEPDVFEDELIEAQSQEQFTVKVRARASGITPLAVSLRTPDGSFEIGQKVVTIRSTEFNEIALGLTIGAFAFLVLFYLMRVARRRSKDEE